MYDWRRMTEEDRAKGLEGRYARQLPWHYVHHNPVHHGYVNSWQDWPWSSATEFLEKVGRVWALKIWKQYPNMAYGKKWDVFEFADQPVLLNAKSTAI